LVTNEMSPAVAPLAFWAEVAVGPDEVPAELELAAGSVAMEGYRAEALASGYSLPPLGEGWPGHHPDADRAPVDPLVEADRQLAHLAQLPESRARASLRAQIIVACLPAVRRAAARYHRSGEPMEDLVQVATLGLIQAVDRFDVSRGVPFRHFALPTILGELKRHFRDKGWSVRVNRRVQELHQLVRRTEPELAQTLGRMPTDADLARHLQLSTAEVRVGRGAGSAYSARSLNWRANSDEDAVELGELLGHEDRDLELVADREALRVALRALPENMRHLLAMRFGKNMTQSQIADKIGVSQMHVSRLIARAVDILRRHMLR